MPEFNLQTHISTGISQKTDLKQALTKQQMLRLNILEENTQNLEMRISTALQQNPMLELESNNMERLEANYGGDAKVTADNYAQLMEYDENLAYVLSHQNGQNLGYDSYVSDIFHRNWDAEAEERRRYYLDSITGDDDPFLNLMVQIDAAALPNEKLAENAKKIAAFIDENGYLRTRNPDNDSPLDVAWECHLTKNEFAQALELIQSLEPAGIGARDVRECLLLQLKRMRLVGSIEWDIVDQYLEDLAENRIPKIAKALKLDIDEIQDAVSRIKTLDPTPGTKVFLRATPTIIPDAIVERDNHDHWVVRTNRGSISTIAINPEYDDMLEEGKCDGETRSFLKEKRQEANELLDAIDKRWETIHRIAAAILEHQMDFFTNGDDAIRPLTQAKIAEELKLDEGTISRAIKDKYLLTPWGARPFKHFFRSGCTSEDGEGVSNVAITARIRKMINEEDKHKPLSDQNIADQLNKEGIQIARKTVQKYRENAGIKSSSKRRMH